MSISSEVMNEPKNMPAMMNMVDYALQAQGVQQQVQLIQSVMKAVMKNGEHYGTIPGCGDKPTLLKAGAEKLLMTFRLAPAYHIDERQLANEHREYVVTATLTSIVTGHFIGQGVGSCSTMEGKYRYRTGSGEITDIDVPKSYWDNRNPEILRKLANEAGYEGDKFGTKKDSSGKWKISTFGEKVENENPADYYNTCLKMAQKRALVAATLTATAASDIFTQDLEDALEAGLLANSASTAKQQRKPETQSGPGKMSEAQRNLLFREMKKSGFEEATLDAATRHYLNQGIEDLTTATASQAINALKNGDWNAEEFPYDTHDAYAIDEVPF